MLRLMVDGANNRAAVMTNTPPANPWTDPAFTNPVANLSACKWHSGLYYLGIDRVLTGTLDLNATNAANGWTQVFDTTGAGHIKTLRTHGATFAPLLIGYFTVDGFNVPMSGDMIISTGSGGSGGMLAVNVYANTSSIVVRRNQISGFALTQARVVSYTIYVCNIGVSSSGAAVFPNNFIGFEATATRLRAGYYDTNCGYFNRDASGSLYLYRGKSTNYQIGTPTFSDRSYCVLGADFNLGTYKRSAGTFPATNTLGVGPATWPGTTSASGASLFTPTTTRFSASMPLATAQTLDASLGRIRFGNTLDSDKNTLLISNYIPVTKTIPALSVGGSTASDSVETIVVGAVSPFATDVLGTATINGQTFAIGGTRQLAAFDYRMTNASGFYQESSTTGAFFYAAGRYIIFELVGNQLVMRVETKWPRLADGAITLPAVTINIKAFAATFDY